MTRRDTGRKPSTRKALVAAVSTVIAMATLPSAGASRPPGRYDQSGISGSEVATMQPVNTGVRIALVASVPGSSEHEAWGIGRTTVKRPGWAGEAEGGQTVIMRYIKSRRWLLHGPPESESGAVLNPKLTSLSVAANGAGWAVGDKGVMFRLRGGRWVQAPSVTEQELTAVSIKSAGSRVFGYAVGQGDEVSGPTILRLSGGTWTADEVPSDPQQKWEVLAVSVASEREAWAVGGASPRNVGPSSGVATLVLHRALHNGTYGWRRLNTGQEMFDGTSVRNVGGNVIVSTRAAAVAATDEGAWVGGTIAPISGQATLGDPAGDATRPFALHFPEETIPTTYCPDQYDVSSDGKATTTSLCEAPFPLSAFGIAALDAVSGAGKGEVFAGGLGLFHFKGGSWFREPDPIGYVTSVSFTHPTEGWIAGSGNTVGLAGSVSSIQTLGHWTTRPAPAHIARWPQPDLDPYQHLPKPLEGVAIAPDGTGRAIAVGQTGATLYYEPEVGWDALTKVTNAPLHGVAWPDATSAWAVGGKGTIAHFDGASWSIDPATGIATTGSLFGVAFNEAGRGYAVGSSGVILSYDGSAWTKDVAASALAGGDDLLTISVAGDEFVAGGTNGKVLATDGGTWELVGGTRSVLARGTKEGQILPALYASAGLPDGTAFLGGELSTLIRRDGFAGPWRADVQGLRVPPEGTIIALAARGTGSRSTLLASVSYDALKFSGETPSAITAFVLLGTAEKGWTDLSHSTRLTTYPAFDASAVSDPVYGLAFDGEGAWAVGGTGGGVDDGQGHAQSFPTSSIYRVEPAGDPRPTGLVTEPLLDKDPNVISFAFFGESACGSALCSVSMGSGTKADVVAAQIRDEVNSMSKLRQGPKFAVFGGDMRATGIPEEVDQFKRFAKGFDVPFFAAMGHTDVFRGLGPSGLNDTGLELEAKPATDEFYGRSFNDFPFPWGNKSAHPEFIPVATDVGDTATAHTHYAFDYAPGGQRMLRIVVLDDSAVGRLSTADGQNPPEAQTQFLTRALTEENPNRGIPVIVVMNRPSANPLDPINRRQDEVGTIESAAKVGASAILTSYFRVNAVSLISVTAAGGAEVSTIPEFVFGGGGAPLEGSPPVSARGAYHSWQLVSVDLGRRIGVGGTQATVSVRSYPVVDTLSIHALDGTTVAGGNTLRFEGLGHTPDGGGAGDPLQSRAAVIPMGYGFRGVCPPSLEYRGNPLCGTVSGPVGPEYRFISEDPTIGYFVSPAAHDERLPVVDAATGLPIPNSSSGLFCALKAGSTYVQLVSGYHIARKKITVTGGSGSCVREPVIEPLEPLAPADPVPLPAAPQQPFLAFAAQEAAQVPIVPPPPVPILAPAPPAAGGFAKREQHKEATESQGSDFVAIGHATRYAPSEDPFAFWFAAVALTLAGACVAAIVVRRTRAAPVRVHSWEARRW